MTSTEIALKLGVSESSIIRFSRSLGFEGFMDFQKNLRKDYQDKVLSISSSITISSYFKFIIDFKDINAILFSSSAGLLPLF